MKKLPDPTRPYAHFIYELLVHGGSTNLGDYEKAGGAHKRLWTVNVAQHMSEGLRDKIVGITQLDRKGERVHGYKIEEEAKAYWRNGVEAALDADKLLAGWRALMSMATVKEPDDGT